MPALSWKAAVEAKVGFPDRATTGPDTDYPCPFCKASHLHVNYGKGAALCHGCKRGFKSLRALLRALGGEIPDFRTRDDGMGDLVEVVDELSRKAVVREQAVQMPKGYFPIQYPCTQRLEIIVDKYLRGRGFTKKDIVELGIGYCTEDKLKGYAIFPVKIGGVLVTWTSRRVTGMGPKQYHAADSKTRYALFNYDLCGMSKRLIFTEGPFDAKAVHARVRPSDGGLGVLGTSFSQEKADAVADLPAEDCIVFMDGDGPGIAAAQGIAKKLIAVGKRVFVTYPPDALDPDELDDDTLKRLLNNAPEVDELDLALEGL